MEEADLQTMQENEKMMVIGIFSLSYNVLCHKKKKRCNSLDTFIMLSSSAFKLGDPKILSFCKCCHDPDLEAFWKLCEKYRKCW